MSMPTQTPATLACLLCGEPYKFEGPSTFRRILPHDCPKKDVVLVPAAEVDRLRAIAAAARHPRLRIMLRHARLLADMAAKHEVNDELRTNASEGRDAIDILLSAIDAGAAGGE